MTAALPGATPATRILLVEDDRVFLRTLELVLKSAGFDVIAVSDYVPALKHLDSGERGRHSADRYCDAWPGQRARAVPHGAAAPPRSRRRLLYRLRYSRRRKRGLGTDPAQTVRQRPAAAGN